MFSKSLQYAKIDNNLDTIGVLYINIGNVFNHRGDSKKAIDYYSRGIRHLEKTGNLIEASKGYSNKGNVLISLGDLEEADKSLLKAIEKAKEKGRNDFWWPYINMIYLRGLQERYEESEEIFNDCFEKMKDRDNRILIGISYMYMGTVKSMHQDYEEAETLLVRVDNSQLQENMLQLMC
jgi:tetratricopeptide (TPR) repeat protein